MLWSRLIASLSVLAINTAMLPGAAHAQEYPSKPVRLVVPWPAGGATDVMARLVGVKLGEALGQPFVIDNKPGASGFIGTTQVAKAPADGYTLLLVTSSTHAISPNLFRSIPYDPIKDFSPIALIATGPMLLVAPPSAPFNNIAELVAQAKAKPGVLNYASYGNGTTPQLAAELFKDVTGTNIVHIPYKGTGPASTAVMTGEVSMYFDAVTSALPQVKGGKLKALGSTGPQRTASTPDVPAIAEVYPGFEASVWYALAAPASTPQAVIDKLNARVLQISKTPEFLERLVALGLTPSSSTPAQVAQYMSREKAKWGEVVKKAGIPVAD
jgi:tripartite-type tricarboxylate transporter receptor subunit TctC